MKTKGGNLVLGKRIAMIREQRNMTQTQLGKLSGMSRSSVNHVEHGTKIARPELLMRVGRALNCSVEELLRPLDAPLPRLRLRHHYFFPIECSNGPPMDYSPSNLARRLVLLASRWQSSRKSQWKS